MQPVAVWVLALLVTAGGASAPAASANPLDDPSGAWMTVSGTVLSIDRRHARLVLRYGPLETAPAGVAECALAGSRVRVPLRSGDRIQALARTDRHPWLLRYARILPQSVAGELRT